MSRLLSLPLIVAALAAVPASAAGAPPWSAPLTIPNALGSSTPVVLTPSGAAAALAAVSRDAPGSTQIPSELVPLGPDGQLGPPQPVSIAAGLLATYAQGHVAVAGSTLHNGTIDDHSHVAVALGTPGSLGSARGLSASTGQRVFGLAGDLRGDVAVVTGDASRHRTLYLRRAGATTFTARLHISVSNPRDATVALGPKGDVLVVWEDNHVIFARHIGPSNHAGAAHRIGDGVQSNLQAAVDDKGRLEVAWKTQRVNEGESNAAAIVRFATAAPGHGFGAQRTVETVDAGRFVGAPGVRMIAEASGRTLLAWTGFDGTHFVVRAADYVDGHRGATQTLSPASEDAVLGDAAARADGEAVVAWRAGVQGADPVPGTTQPVFASHRDPGTSTFGAPEQVSAEGETVPTAPFAALSAVSGRSFVVYAPLSAGVKVNSRP
ncbi:MAG: hypothetical protein V7607_6631 [Solirubrobacteraceae bacterium]